MMKTKRYLYIGLFIIMIMLFGSIWYLQDNWRTKGFPLIQETNDWANWRKKLPADVSLEEIHSPLKPNELKPGIFLRDSAENSNLLLLKHSIGDGVYSFDKNANETDRTSEEEWLKATGKIVICEDQRWTRQDILNIDNHKYKFFKGDDVNDTFPTYGRYALDAVASPSKKKAAVISASGLKRPLISFGWVGLGGENFKIYGQRYIQMLNLQTDEYLDKSVKLFSKRDLPYFSACWSSDKNSLCI